MSLINPGSHLEEDARVPRAENIGAVGVFLCPNRNLTTLTAAILSFHPRVQVLNHGFERLQAAGLLRFLHSHSDADLDAFARGSIEMSATGRRGNYGGSILLSHAYDRPALRAAYAKLYGEASVKQDIGCVVWKDGARLREYLRANQIDPVALAERLPRLHFISPLREPVAHLRSLQKYYATESWEYVRQSLPDLGAESVARYILTAHDEFLHWRERRPQQFFAFTQGKLGLNTARELANFLQVAAIGDWERLVPEFFADDSGGTDAPELKSLFTDLLDTEYAGSAVANIGLC
jgi:hypothetical protein